MRLCCPASSKRASQAWPNIGQHWRTSADSSATVGQLLTALGQHRPTFCQSRPNSVKCWPAWANPGHLLAQLGQFGPKFAQSGPDLENLGRRHWPMLGSISADGATVRTLSGNFGTSSELTGFAWGAPAIATRDAAEREARERSATRKTWSAWPGRKTHLSTLGHEEPRGVQKDTASIGRHQIQHDLVCNFRASLPHSASTRRPTSQPKTSRVQSARSAEEAVQRTHRHWGP